MIYSEFLRRRVERRQLLFGENHRCSTADAQRARSVPFVDSYFQIAAGTEIRDWLAGLSSRKSIDQPANRVSSDLHFQAAAVLRFAGQILGAEIRHQVPERVDLQYQAFGACRASF